MKVDDLVGRLVADYEEKRTVVVFDSLFYEGADAGVDFDSRHGRAVFWRCG